MARCCKQVESILEVEMLKKPKYDDEDLNKENEKLHKENVVCS